MRKGRCLMSVLILRQRDTKPEEFAEYNAFVEKVKEEERDVG